MTVSVGEDTRYTSEKDFGLNSLSPIRQGCKCKHASASANTAHAPRPQNSRLV